MTNEGFLDWFEPTDMDIQRVCRMLRLKPDAYLSAASTNQRLNVLKAKQHIDVEACPGSGKTTLLVAKLALLAEKWPHRTRGICVISHTNVARREIEDGLGNTAEGRALLSYPHFVGTIHGFVNEFVAKPYIRSKGKPVDLIDDELVLRWRWNLLSRNIRYGLEQSKGRGGAPENSLRIKSADLDFSHISNEGTRTFNEITRIAQHSINVGRYCHEEMLIFAQRFISLSDLIHIGVRKRFPVLFLDEVQDTDATQADLIHAIFTDRKSNVVQQRFGDSNQAIFFGDAAQEESANATHRFPIDDRKRVILNSYRFGQSIADLVSPLAVSPVCLVGLREIEENSSQKNAIFLFDLDHVHQVPIAFSNYLRNVCSEDELKKGDFVVIGAVHRRIDDAPHHHRPKSLGHYWSDYDATISSINPTPKTFVQYVHAGCRLSDQSGDSSQCVEKSAEAMLCALKSVASSPPINLRMRKHRQVLNLIGDDRDLRAEYIALIRQLAIDRGGLEHDVWESKTRVTVTRIVRALAKSEDGLNSEDELADFLRFPTDIHEVRTNDNRLSVPGNKSPNITLRFGSIHSVKGETHTATLVVDTFNDGHHLAKLKPWLLGEKAHGTTETKTLKARMRLHYVASTRPTKLLCLALRKDLVNENEIEALTNRGWKIGVIDSNASINWN